jgi:hypothetical protein
VVPNVVFTSSKTPNLTIHHRDNDPQTANEIEAFFHQILYPLPNGSGLSKVRTYFFMIIDINDGITSILQHPTIQQFAETKHTYLEPYPFDSFETGLVGLFFDKVPEYLNREEFADKIHISIQINTRHIKRGPSSSGDDIPFFEIVPKYEESIDHRLKVSTNALAAKCSAKDIEKLETLILATTDRDFRLGTFLPYSLTSTHEELLCDMMSENNKYAAHKSIVKVTGVPRELRHTPLRGSVPASTL